MTEIEEEFYKTFDIKPVTLKDFNYNTLNYGFKTICINEVRYPKITDRILLELICILNDFDDGHYESITLDKLKQEVLEDLIYYHNAIGNIANQELRDKVLSLFEEGVEDDRN